MKKIKQPNYEAVEFELDNKNITEGIKEAVIATARKAIVIIFFFIVILFLCVL